MRGWYGGLLAGLLPILLLGFGYSALADRTSFLVWALGLAAAWVLLLHQGMKTGGLLLLLAAGLGGFAWLESRHHESLDLGFRAVLPGIYHPALTAPLSAGVAAGLLGAAGLGLAFLKREAR